MPAAVIDQRTAEQIAALARLGLGFEDIALRLSVDWRLVRPLVLGLGNRKKLMVANDVGVDS